MISGPDLTGIKINTPEESCRDPAFGPGPGLAALASGWGGLFLQAIIFYAINEDLGSRTSCPMNEY